jgi:hypothetical protein
MDAVVEGGRRAPAAISDDLGGKLPAPKGINRLKAELNRLAVEVGGAFRDGVAPRLERASEKAIGVVVGDLNAAERLFKKDAFMKYAEGLANVILEAIDPDAGVKGGSVDAASKSAIGALNARARENAERGGLPVSEERLLMEKYSILESAEERNLVKGLVLEAVRSGVAVRNLLLFVGATAAIVAAQRDRKKAEKEKEAAELRERELGRRRDDENVAGSEMASVIGVQDIVEKLGLDPTEAQELLMRLQGSDAFRKLMRENPEVQPSSVLALSLAYDEAERVGMKPDVDGSVREDDGADTITFPGADFQDGDLARAA